MTKFKNFIKHATPASVLLKQVGHPDRITILCSLSEKELSAGELAKNSKLSLSAFSQHLAVLRHANIIKLRKSAQTIYYSIKDESVLEIISTLSEIFSDRSNELIEQVKR